MSLPIFSLITVMQFLNNGSRTVLRKCALHKIAKQIIEYLLTFGKKYGIIIL